MQLYYTGYRKISLPEQGINTDYTIIPGIKQQSSRPGINERMQNQVLVSIRHGQEINTVILYRIRQKVMGLLIWKSTSLVKYLMKVLAALQKLGEKPTAMFEVQTGVRQECVMFGFSFHHCGRLDNEKHQHEKTWNTLEIHVHSGRS